jgi:DNA-directed RNA polymerase II subunit RPB2
MSKGKQIKSKDTDSFDEIRKYDAEPFWTLIDLFFQSNKQFLVAHLIDSYNQFIREIIPSIVLGKHVINESVTQDKCYRTWINIEDLTFSEPKFENGDLMFPLGALQQNQTMYSEATAFITQYLDIIDVKSDEVIKSTIAYEKENMILGKIPVMTKSILCNLTQHPEIQTKHCPYDQGGVFIVNGNEKVMLTIASKVQRKIMVVAKTEQNVLTYYAEVKSRAEANYVGPTQDFSIKMKRNGMIMLNIKMFNEVSIFVLMRALGLATDNMIINSITDINKDKSVAEQLVKSFELSGNKNITKEQAIEIMISKMKSTRQTSDDEATKALQKRAHLRKILSHIILPHISTETGDEELDMLEKARYIGYMIKKLVTCYVIGAVSGNETKGCDDRDKQQNKVLDLPGYILGNLFEQHFNIMKSDCTGGFRRKQSETALDKPPKIILKQNTIEQALRQVLATGQYQNKKGISQMLNRFNNQASVAHMRRSFTPISDASTNKIVSIREMHMTQFGTYCQLETPEGPKTGLVMNFSLSTTVTMSMPQEAIKIREYLMSLIGTKILTEDTIKSPEEVHKFGRIFLNGNPIGRVLSKDIMHIHSVVKKRRANGEYDRRVGLYIDYNNNELWINTKEGRAYRPYLTVTDNKLNFKPEMLVGIKTFEEFLHKYPGCIEFIDKDEEMNIMLAMFPTQLDDARKIMDQNPIIDDIVLRKISQTNRYDAKSYVKYTHCELHPALILGVISSNIPFCNRNQSVRGIYNYSQSKQAMGLNISDYRERTDNTYNLYYSQVPITTPRTSKYTGAHIFTAGENSILAIMSLQGYNQEDAQVMNQSAVDKGYMRACTYKKQQSPQQIKGSQGANTVLYMKPVPEKVDGIRLHADYSKLGEDGVPPVETTVYNTDIIIGMVVHNKMYTQDDKPYKDQSVAYKATVPGVIDRINRGTDSDGMSTIKLRLRIEKIPEHGDKFTSRHGQKGTIAALFRRKDMPYSESGIIPDLVTNPNGISKRVTPGQLIEGTLSKVCALNCTYGDGTAYSYLDMNELEKELTKFGLPGYGNETMYCGMTGQKMTNAIFLTVVYYQRLKHMVSDKVHARSIGQSQLLTRQPVEGRARAGGFKIGEMERDSICAHGMAYFTKETMYDRSDKYTEHFCDICGFIVREMKKKNNENPDTPARYVCDLCQNRSRISRVNLPYATKLFLQELMALGIGARIRTKNSVV